MMARQVARQFCRLGEVHSLVYGTPGKRQEWPQTDRQHSRRLREPPNGLSGLNKWPYPAALSGAAAMNYRLDSKYL